MRGLYWSVMWLVAAPAVAQIVIPPSADPGALQQRQIEEERRRREMEREERKPVTEPLKHPEQAEPVVQPGQDAVRFMVREIRFTESAILSTEDLAKSPQATRDVVKTGDIDHEHRYFAV